jgi:hypothetical protein
MAALATCLFATPAFADTREGVYVFASAGQSYARYACSYTANNVASTGATGITGGCTEQSIAFRAGFGYQYNPTWALEVNYGQFGFASQSGYGNFPLPIGPGNYSWQLKALGLAVQAVATVHVTHDLSFLGKFGLARVEFDEFLGVNPTAIAPPPGTTGWYYYPTVNDKRNTVALGAGVQLELTPRSSLRLMVESFGAHDIYNIYGVSTKVRLLTGSLGLVYRY